MCCIGGLIFNDNQNIEKKKQIIKDLLISMTDRGIDASGIALINTEEDKIIIHKLPIDAFNFVKDKKFNNLLNKELINSNLVFLHTRQATNGKKEDNNNNHPIYDKEFNSVLIHNGIISNYSTIKERYNFKTDGEVDSEIILKLSDKFKNWEKTYDELSGSFAFAHYHNKILTLMRFSNPLCLGYIKDLNIILFCSTKEIIIDALSDVKNYFGGLFSERRMNYTTIFKEIKKSSAISFNFLGKYNNFKCEDIILNSWYYDSDKDDEKKKNKSKKDKHKSKNENKGKTNNKRKEISNVVFINSKDNHLNNSYFDKLKNDGEEYEGEFKDEEFKDRELKSSWEQDLEDEGEYWDYEFNRDNKDDKDDKEDSRKGYSDTAQGLMCDGCGYPYQNCACNIGGRNRLNHSWGSWGNRDFD